jgi:pimeloyl-ACP methyl ester carboxylesterase
MLHGFPDNAQYYARTMDFADAGYRTVAPFLRGYAPTEVLSPGSFDPSPWPGTWRASSSP